TRKPWVWPAYSVMIMIEQAALLDFLERAPRWSDARKLELSDLLEPLTGSAGMEGLRRACGMGLWLRQGGADS
ncbi:MAG TPA: hypothetical protein PK490_12330, partial [Prosthecobacter sp.]|nr:hypothetical protein [Prosthecobacter sp.]